MSDETDDSTTPAAGESSVPPVPLSSGVANSEDIWSKEAGDRAAIDAAVGASGAAPPTRSRALVVAVAIVAAVALIAGGVVWWARSRNQTVAASTVPANANATCDAQRPPAGGGSAGSAVPSTTAGTAAGGSGAVGPSGERGARGERGGTLRVGVIDEPEGWDPTRFGFSPSASLVASAIYDSLAYFDDDGVVRPQLAKSIEMNGDGTIFTIGLRSGVFFDDGTPLEGEVVRENLTSSQRTLVIAATLEPIEAVTVPDPMTVVIKMSRPWPAFPTMLATQTGFIASTGTIASEAGAKRPHGTGPFVLDDWTPGEKIELKRNPTYWGAIDVGGPMLDAIEVRAIADESARLAAYRAGEVDVVLANDGRAATQAFPDDAEQLTDSFVNFIALNLSTAPFDDIDARRALALATDRDAVLANMGGGRTAISSPFPPDSPWCEPDTGYPAFDLEAAKRTAAAYTRRTGNKIVFELQVPSTDESTRAGTALVEMWARAGIEATMRPVVRSNLTLKVLTGSYTAALHAQPSAKDPDLLYPTFHTSIESESDKPLRLNVPRMSDQHVDALLERGRVQQQRADRQATYADMVRNLNRVTPYVWLWTSPQGILVRSGVGGSDDLVAQLRSPTRPWAATVWITR